MKSYKKITLISLIVMLLVMAIATFAEKFKGTPFVTEHVYRSWWFVGIWFIFGISMLLYLLQERVYKQPMIFLLHASFLVILSGAFMTLTTCKQGTVHLRMGKPVDTFVDKKSNEQQNLPFEITLSDFQVVNYPGTQAPADYVSHITVKDGQDKVQGQISMNKIYTRNGYRFYQSGYDRDRQGTILMVKIDRFGLPITYCGYVLLLLGMIGFFFSEHTGFRTLLHHPLLKKGAMVILLLLIVNGVRAEGKTLPEKSAKEFGEVQMLYRGRIVPLQTFAKEFTLKLYGKSSYKVHNAEQVLSGWLLYPETWMDEKMIKVKDKEVRQILGIEGKYASFSDFFIDGKEYKLEEMINRIYLGEPPKKMREILAADEKVQLIFMLQTGASLTIFPEKERDELVWLSPAAELSEQLPESEKLLIRGYFELLRQYAEKDDFAAIALTIDKLKVFQRKKAGEMLPAPAKIKAERFYNRFNVVKPITFLNLLSGIFALLCFFNIQCKTITHSSKFIILILNIFLILSWVGIVTGLVLRGYISGRVPLGNSFETMQFLASSIMLSALLFQRRFFLFLPFGFIFSALVLLVSSMGAANPQITQLQPVLASPLLSIHVSLIMIAYTLFGFVTFTAIFALLQFFIMKRKGLLSEIEARLTQMLVMSKIVLYPAVFLLAAGIFVGATWAEISWGTYWSWDPKETWALITLIIYGLAIHPITNPQMQRPLFFHIYTLFAFFTLLMTYFGVNYLLGGMHSYGG